jgi:hypothetical protein
MEYLHVHMKNTPLWYLCLSVHVIWYYSFINKTVLGDYLSTGMHSHILIIRNGLMDTVFGSSVLLGVLKAVAYKFLGCTAPGTHRSTPDTPQYVVIRPTATTPRYCMLCSVNEGMVFGSSVLLGVLKAVG